jgi:formamidopyrimidine-DNA glycosylase
MPELPEVETVRRGLADLLPGQAVVRATVFDSPKSFPNSPISLAIVCRFSNSFSP